MGDRAGTHEPGDEVPPAASGGRPEHPHGPRGPRATRVADAVPRRPLSVRGVVTAVAVHDAGGPVLRATLDDGTGSVELCFFGRRNVPGIAPGAQVAADGVVLVEHGRLRLVNPRYHFLA